MLPFLAPSFLINTLILQSEIISGYVGRVCGQNVLSGRACMGRAGGQDGCYVPACYAIFSLNSLIWEKHDQDDSFIKREINSHGAALSIPI